MAPVQLFLTPLFLSGREFSAEYFAFVRFFYILIRSTSGLPTSIEIFSQIAKKSAFLKKSETLKADFFSRKNFGVPFYSLDFRPLVNTVQQATLRSGYLRQCILVYIQYVYKSISGREWEDLRCGA
jgi:hypothetical protein